MREKYFNTAIQSINQGLKQFGSDSVLKYYYSVALVLQGITFLVVSITILFSNIFIERIHEAVKDLDFLKTRDDVGLGALLALIHAHKKFTTIGTFFYYDIKAFI